MVMSAILEVPGAWDEDRTREYVKTMLLSTADEKASLEVIEVALKADLETEV